MDSHEKGEQGERFVNEYAFNSFLKYWCYPGPLDIVGDNREICDLLIVFDDVCIIISVKNYFFKGSYEPYFNRTVRKALRQIAGAERRLFGNKVTLLRHPDRLDEQFDKDKIKTRLRIVVNLNTEVKFYEPSLYINGTHHVNVFDAEAWSGIVNEFNTVPDLVNYLTRRDTLFKGRPCIMLPREEYDFSENDGNQLSAYITKLYSSTPFHCILGSELDLIATYIKNIYDFPKSLKELDDRPFTMMIDGEWTKYVNSKFIVDKNKFELDSYLIDSLVKNYLIIQPNGDKIAKMLYRLDRLNRARFCKELYKFHEAQRAKKPLIQLHRANATFDGHHFVLVYFDTDAEYVDAASLEGFIDKSLCYHSYLYGYNCTEIGCVAVSADFQSFAFGYMPVFVRFTDAEKSVMEDDFIYFGWKLKDDVNKPPLN